MGRHEAVSAPGNGLDVGGVLQVLDQGPFLLGNLEAAEDQAPEFGRDTVFEGGGRDGGEDANLEVLLGEAAGEGSPVVREFVDHDPEGPDVRLGAIGVVEEALGGHVEGGADVEILEVGPRWWEDYLAWTANPKSAILATPFLRKTLATLRSLWMMPLEER